MPELLVPLAVPSDTCTLGTCIHPLPYASTLFHTHLTIDNKRMPLRVLSLERSFQLT